MNQTKNRIILIIGLGSLVLMSTRTWALSDDPKQTAGGGGNIPRPKQPLPKPSPVLFASRINIADLNTFINYEYADRFIGAAYDGNVFHSAYMLTPGIYTPYGHPNASENVAPMQNRLYTFRWTPRKSGNNVSAEINYYPSLVGYWQAHQGNYSYEHIGINYYGLIWSLYL